MLRLPLHGVGTQEDLLLPFWLTLAVAGTVVVVSFAVLGLRRVTTTRTLTLPRAANVAVALVLPLLRVGGLALFGWMMLAAWGGPDDALNPTPLITYVVLWVLVIAIGSAVFGPLYPALDPVRTLWLSVSALLRRQPDRGVLGQLPSRAGYWGASVALIVFAWLELILPQGDSTAVLRTFFLVLWIVNGVGVTLFGTSWLDRADGFTVTSQLYGHLSPMTRDPNNALVARVPLRSAENIPVRPGLTAVITLLLATTLWDGLSERFAAWSTLGKTAGFLSAYAALALLYWLSTSAVMKNRQASLMFAPSLVPIALGYIVAHYWTFLIIGGQQAIIRSSDPFGVGQDLLGSGGWGISYALVGSGLVATIKVTAVILGHVAGVLVAHRIAARELPVQRWLKDQIPLLVLMVFITITGLLLLFPE